MTNDIDLVLDLDSDNILAAMEALAELGYRPRIPVSAKDFADPATRARWIREKGMQVLNLHSERFRTTPIDLFVEEPFPFDTAYDMAIESAVDGIPFRYVDIKTLIHMKETAGRPVDQEDVRQLRLIDSDDEPLADN